MDSKSCDDVSTVNGDGEWANFSSDPELLYGSRKIPNENARKVNVNDQQSSSDGAENAVMGENEITVLIKILVEEMNGGADFLPEICVEKKFEAVPLAVGEEEEEKQKQPIIVANLLQELPAIIGEYYDAISIEQFVPVVYANSKTFPEMLITMGRREKLENGGKYFVKMFQNTQHRGIGSQLGCSSATLRTSMASFAPSQFNFPTAPNGPNKFQSTPGFGPFNLQQQQQNSVDNQNWQLKLQHAILEIQKKLEKMKKLKHEEMAEHCNFQSKIKELELKLAELVEGQISKETEQQSKFVEIEKMLDELKNAEKPKNDGFHKRMEELKIGFDRAQDHQTKVNFLRSLAPNSQQLEVNVSGAAGEILTDELSWKKLLEAIATTGSECASIRIRDVQLPSAYEFTFAQELLAMASGPENVTMVKHLEFALRGMAGLDPMILARFGEHWPQQNQVILRANALNGFTVEMMMENSKILEFKMVHINCVCKANCSLGMHFTHPWFDLDGYLYAISGGKKRFYLTNLPAPLKNCALLFNICSTKGAMFEFIDLQLENNLECDLLAKLINFWQSKEIKNGIRHIILRDSNKLDATTFDRILSCKQLYKSDTNGCSQFVWQVINSPVVEECYVIKFKSTTSDGTLIECSRMDTTAVAYTITPFDVNGNNILIEDTLTQAWISSWASTTTITISRTCNVDSILTFMQQRPELLPNQFDFQFPTGTGASIAPSAQILALMEEKNIACHHSSNGANFCCGRHCYQSMAGCINASYAYLHCCGYHTKTYPPICIHPTNKANCCKNGHQIYPHSHKHYILGSGNDKFELKIYIANTNNTINCLIGKKCA